MNTIQAPGRRQALVTMAGGLTGGLVMNVLKGGEDNSMQAAETKPKIKGHLKQSISRWCFGKWSLDELCKQAARIGYQGLDLVGSQDWPTLKKYGLTCAVNSASGPVQINSGLNRRENHAAIVESLKKEIELAAAAGVPNVICFSGNRTGMSDEEGLQNCLVGVKQVAGYAEKNGVTLCMELLNSKVDHKDYMCDHTAWGVKLVKAVGSPRFKLLYDIYHMQIMEGDVIRTISENIESIAHMHTAGVPGRHEIDGSQELNYPAICKAIVKAGYKGFLGQEFVPVGDPLASLEQAFQLCDV
jgi:hydroxypyruvate isomerase